MNFLIDLDTYRGPLDLLLFLVRKHEVDIKDIPIALVTDQFVEYLSVLETLDIDAVGDFLDLASTLVEIKSRMVLPHDPEEEAWEDPRQQLVEQLLEYKQYKDAASMLEETSRAWQKRYERMADDLPPRRIDPADQPIHEIEMWDLVSAFGRVMRSNRRTKPSSIVYDDTPIHVYMQRIRDRLLSHGRVAFSEMFQTGMHKSALIGVFLAILELVRHHCVQTEQQDTHGEIWIVPGDEFSSETDFSTADNYSHRRPVADDLPIQPR